MVTPILPSVLFIPNAVGGGTGEVMRSLILANAIMERWKDAKIEFLVRDNRPYLDVIKYPKHVPVLGKMKRRAYEILILDKTRPDIVVFDGYGDSKTIEECYRRGIQVIFISWDKGALNKAFRLSKLFKISQHWVIQDDVTTHPLTLTKMALSRLPGSSRIEIAPTVHEEISPDSVKYLPADIREFLNSPFNLFFAGGGGLSIEGYPASEVYLDAAEQLADLHGMRSIVVMGPSYKGNKRESKYSEIKVVSSLSNRDLLSVAQFAQVAVCNGGISVHELMSLGLVCVGADLGMPDQARRLNSYSRETLMLEAMPTIDSLCRTVLRVYDLNSSERINILKQMQRYPLNNGLHNLMLAFNDVVNSIHTSSEAIAQPHSRLLTDI